MPGTDDEKKQPDENKKEEEKKDTPPDQKPAEDAKGEPVAADDKAKDPNAPAENADGKPADYVNFGGEPGGDDPYANDEETYKEHFRKTFITQDKNKKENENLFTLHDMMIPAGRTAKLVRVPDPNDQEFRVTEPLDKLKFIEPTPVIILAGAMTERAGKTLAGVSRAAFRAGATVIDSGIGSGIEKFCMRKSVPLIGVCPENEIKYPVNSQNKKENELTNGHTHFFLIGSDESNKRFKWGEEAKMKAEIAKRVAKGRSKYGNTYACKIIMVVVGDNPDCVQDIIQAKENNFPIVVLEGSQLCADIIAAKGGLPEDEPAEEEKKGDEAEDEEGVGSKKPPQETAPVGGDIKDADLAAVVGEQKMFLCKQNSEHIANISHLLLTVTL